MDRQMVALLGTDSDRNVAAFLGLTHPSVFRKRRILAIAPYQKAPYLRQLYPWTSRADALPQRLRSKRREAPGDFRLCRSGTPDRSGRPSS